MKPKVIFNNEKAVNSYWKWKLVTAQIRFNTAHFELITTPNFYKSVVDCQRESWVTGWVEWENKKLANVVQCNILYFLDKEI